VAHIELSGDAAARGAAVACENTWEGTPILRMVTETSIPISRSPLEDRIATLTAARRVAAAAIQKRRETPMSTITTNDGTTIYYKDWGSGQPIVFSHGWPLSSDDFDAQMQFFGEHGFRCIAHERPWPRPLVANLGRQ
jgi:hypothetical protein